MMYLLLRNNKQSGPYSLDDLKTMGLKAYDLVWVEGKSAAWRYPCEINELSAFAPAVEEQPFDRFFRKASPVKANNNSSVIHSSPGHSSAGITSDSPKPMSEPAASSPMITGEPSTVPGKRIIYVTMPAGNGHSTPVPVAVSKPVPTMNKSESRPVIDDFEYNYSQSQQEETPVVEFLPRPKKRRSNLILKPLVIGLALLAAGIFIGLSINKDTISFQPKIRSGFRSADQDNGQTNQTVAQQLPVPAVKNDPVPVLSTGPKRDTVATIIGHAIPAEPVVSRSAVDQGAIDRSGDRGAIDRGTIDRSGDRSGKAPAQKGRSVNGNAKTQALSPSPVKDSSSGAASNLRREAVHRADVVEKPETGADKDANVKANIASQVSVGANGYTVGTFGGINDLKVTVTNRSVYPLDLVVVEVQYIQANKKIYKTENLYFRGIGAGSALMQEAPKSSRGIKVQYKITTINSKEPGLSYSGI